jgi:NAD(P)-dependent dehydrogenase (short-subunit alcohol dehydrogenase family)
VNPKVAAVTGASRGIGAAIAAALLDDGACVGLCARGPQALAAAAQRLGRGREDRVFFRAADVREYGEVEAFLGETAKRFGGLDVVVANAGVAGFENVAEMPLETWNETIGTNLTGAFHTARAAIPLLRRRGGGWIVFVSSLSARYTHPGMAAYNASKFGLAGFAEALMQEVRDDGIRVVEIRPGSVATEFDHPSGAPTDWMLAPEDVARAVLDCLAHPSRSLPSRIEIRPSRPLRRS